MPIAIGDTLSETGDLSAEEFGAYILLLMRLWESGALPQEDARLSRIARLSTERWQEIQPSMCKLFEDGWRHPRLEQERVRSEELYRLRSEAGKKGALVKAKNKSQGNAQHEQRHQRGQQPRQDPGFQPDTKPSPQPGTKPSHQQNHAEGHKPGMRQGEGPRKKPGTSNYSHPDSTTQEETLFSRSGTRDEARAQNAYAKSKGV
ncbi:hypothetical protein X762_18025 [Mesorhizobium sp. LSHC426A00]|nr:hypothetical protein X762_18025 [Mesorhizobium sp. LSHC426A00]ESX69836.1 hypothetical protein X758_19140 [Mesorhizobium sp. LSHC416B00]ESX71796.1 hypothetical protein X757_22265 [Mesorhizobium sp. LSHC414A00]